MSCIVRGGEGCCNKFLKLKRAKLTVSVKNWGSDVASQYDRNVLAFWFGTTLLPFLTLTVNIAQFIVRNLSKQPPPPSYASLTPFRATSLPPFWHLLLTSFKGVSDKLWGGCCGKFITMKCARLTLSVKNGESDVAAQNARKRNIDSVHQNGGVM